MITTLEGLLRRRMRRVSNASYEAGRSDGLSHLEEKKGTHKEYKQEDKDENRNDFQGLLSLTCTTCSEPFCNQTLFHTCSQVRLNRKKNKDSKNKSLANHSNHERIISNEER